jgi:hypothetical protein
MMSINLHLLYVFEFNQVFCIASTSKEQSVFQKLFYRFHFFLPEETFENSLI